MALKDKLMTLEDFKAVRDVDVASNQAQFSAIRTDLNAQVGDINYINESMDDIQTQIGDLSELETSEKSSLVGAINEAAQSGGSEITVDDTLTTAGAAADAKKTGDEISEIKADLDNLNNAVNDFGEQILDGKISLIEKENNGFIGGDGSVCAQTANLEKYTNRFAVNPGEKITISFSIASSTTFWLASAEYASDGTFIRRRNLDNSTVGTSITYTYTIPSDVYFVALTYRTYGTHTILVTKPWVFYDNMIAGMNDLDTNRTRLPLLDGYTIIDPDNFDIGNISISTSGWAYSNNQNRVRTKQGTTYPMRRGDVISLTSYTNARIYLGWQRQDGTYGEKGWVTSDYTIMEDGNYVILLANLTDTSQGENKMALLNLLRIKRHQNAYDLSASTANRLNATMTPLLEVGDITINTSGWDYSYNSKRIRTKQGTPLKLYAGDTIGLTDYSKYRFIVGWRVGTTYKRISNWRTEDLYLEESGDYVIVISTVGNDAPEDIREMMDSLFINHSSGEADINKPPVYSTPYIKSINHRGYNLAAPENTIPAYKLSKLMEFEYVETDVSFTSDDVPVLLHDGTINRTARNSDGTEIASTVNIYDITYEQALTYDFGIWKGTTYAGTKIPTLEQFCIFCKKTGLIPYIEIKTDGSYTSTQLDSMLAAVQKSGIIDKVTFLSFSDAYLSYVKTKFPNVRLGYLVGTITETDVAKAIALRTNTNEVFIDAAAAYITDETLQYAMDENVPVEVWAINAYTEIQEIAPYITGITSDLFVASIIIATTEMNA